MPTIGLQHSHADDEIPGSHRDLVDCPPVAALTTLMPDGSPQTSVVWCDTQGGVLRVNTMRGFRKERNMRRDPRVTLLCYDPRQPLRYLEIRGAVASMTENDAQDHLDRLASKYMGRPVRYFGDCVAAELAATEMPVLIRIEPDHVVAIDATGGPGTQRTIRLDRRTPPDPTGGPRRQGSTLAPPAATPTVTLPLSHLDLIGAPNHGVLTTLMPDGRPQSSLVWLDHDGECALVNTTLERQKGRNLRADPAVSLLVVDADDTGRYIQVRGDAELVLDGAIEHLDEITRRYTRHPGYYGHVYPVGQRDRETRVIVRIRARRITLDAIHR